MKSSKRSCLPRRSVEVPTIIPCVICTLRRDYRSMLYYRIALPTLVFCVFLSSGSGGAKSGTSRRPDVRSLQSRVSISTQLPTSTATRNGTQNATHNSGAQDATQGVTQRTQGRRRGLLTRPRPLLKSSDNVMMPAAPAKRNIKGTTAQQEDRNQIAQSQLLHVLEASKASAANNINGASQSSEGWLVAGLFPKADTEDGSDDSHSCTAFCSQVNGDLRKEDWENVGGGQCCKKKTESGQIRRVRSRPASWRAHCNGKGPERPGMWPIGDRVDDDDDNIDECWGDGDGYLTLRPFPSAEEMARLEAQEDSSMADDDGVSERVDVPIAHCVADRKKVAARSSLADRFLEVFKQLQPARRALNLEDGAFPWSTMNGGTPISVEGGTTAAERDTTATERTITTAGSECATSGRVRTAAQGGSANAQRGNSTGKHPGTINSSTTEEGSGMKRSDERVTARKEEIPSDISAAAHTSKGVGTGTVASEKDRQGTMDACDKGTPTAKRRKVGHEGQTVRGIENVCSTPRPGSAKVVVNERRPEGVPPEDGSVPSPLRRPLQRGLENRSKGAAGQKIDAQPPRDPHQAKRRANKVLVSYESGSSSGNERGTGVTEYHSAIDLTSEPSSSDCPASGTASTGSVTGIVHEVAVFNSRAVTKESNAAIGENVRTLGSAITCSAQRQSNIPAASPKATAPQTPEASSRLPSSSTAALGTSARPTHPAPDACSSRKSGGTAETRAMGPDCRPGASTTAPAATSGKRKAISDLSRACIREAARVQPAAAARGDHEAVDHKDMYGRGPDASTSGSDTDWGRTGAAAPGGGSGRERTQWANSSNNLTYDAVCEAAGVVPKPTSSASGNVRNSAGDVNAARRSRSSRSITSDRRAGVIGGAASSVVEGSGIQRRPLSGVSRITVSSGVVRPTAEGEAIGVSVVPHPVEKYTVSVPVHRPLEKGTRCAELGGPARQADVAQKVRARLRWFEVFNEEYL